MYMLGMIVGLVGGIWIVVNAFRESVLWGLGCLLFPLVSLIFVVMNWSDNWRPFLVCVLGAVLTLMGTPPGPALVGPEG